MKDWYEIGLIVFILVGIALASWRSGKAYPVGTGTLDKGLRRVDGELVTLTGKVTKLETRVEDIDLRSAKASDIARLEEQLRQHRESTEAIARDITAMRERIAANAAEAKHVRHQVDALYDVIVKKGMDA